MNRAGFLSLGLLLLSGAAAAEEPMPFRNAVFIQPAAVVFWNAALRDSQDRFYFQLAAGYERELSPRRRLTFEVTATWLT